MERKQIVSDAAGIPTAVSALLLACAAGWDAFLAGRGTAPPSVSYALMPMAVAALFTGLLWRVLARLRRLRTDVMPAGILPARNIRRVALRTTAELLIGGLVLLGWWLRGHPAIPADPPIVGIEVVGAFTLAVLTAVARRSRAVVTDPSAR